MKKGEELAAIPKESVNDEGTALAKDFGITLPSTKPDGSHKIKKPLEVQAQNGQRFRLPKNTNCSYTLPETKAGYKVTIPKGTSLTKKEGTTPQEYTLAKDITVAITPPENFRSTLTVDAQKVIERIPGYQRYGYHPNDQAQAGPRRRIHHTDGGKSDSDFDFSKARFYVCLRKRGDG